MEIIPIMCAEGGIPVVYNVVGSVIVTIPGIFRSLHLWTGRKPYTMI